MSANDDNEFDPEEIAIIKEVYDNENAHEAFGEELERALEAGCNIIVIEPPRLGDETARWIAVGNCLHKTAVLSGLGAVVCGIAWAEFPYTYTPLSVMSFFCTGLYTVSWQFDPCVKYQVYTDSKKLAKLPLFNALSSASPTVLIRKNDTKQTNDSFVSMSWRQVLELLKACKHEISDPSFTHITSDSFLIAENFETVLSVGKTFMKTEYICTLQ